MSFKDDWNNLEPLHKKVLIGITAAGLLGIGINSVVRSSSTTNTGSTPSGNTQASPVNPKDPAFSATAVLPSTPRNQGLETLAQSVQAMKDEFSKVNGRIDSLEYRSKPNPGQPASNPPTQPDAASNALNRPLPDSPGPVSFDQPASNSQPKKNSDSQFDFQVGGQPPANTPSQSPKKKSREMVEMLPDDLPLSAAEQEVLTVAVPVNSGIDAIVMNGFNASSAGGSTGQVGTVLSTNAVGAPFVTKLKGDVILPNGFRVSDLGECLLGGSAIAKMNAERAIATADTLSCVKLNGEIWEGKVKAYAVDNDGTLGIAGKVVSKQGTVLMQAAISGMASGLGSALTPTAALAVNTSNSGNSGVQLPNMGNVGYTMLGQGLQNATAQLSKFYLQYASEVIPVVEVVSGTRLTWIFRETFELQRTDKQNKKGRK